MRTLNQWLDEYGESHKNETNKLIHWICVPAIFFSVIGLLYGVKLPVFIGDIQLNLAFIVTAFAMIFYMSLTKTLWIGMLLFTLLCLGICYGIEKSNALPLWLFCLIIFIIAWIGQFFGHKIEGKKPSFLKDLVFLLIGPAWLMSFIYKRVGILI